MEKSLQEWMQRLRLKCAARDLLQDFDEFDVNNDPKWQVAREIAWQEEKPKYLTQ